MVLKLLNSQFSSILLGEKKSYLSNQTDEIHFLNDKTIFMVTIYFSYYFLSCVF